MRKALYYNSGEITLWRFDNVRIGRSATKHPNVSRRPYGTLAEGERSSTIPHEGHDNQIKAEILNSHVIRSTAQIYGVGEIPLNGKGIPLTHNGEGEEIVKTHVKAWDV